MLHNCWKWTSNTKYCFSGFIVTSLGTSRTGVLLPTLGLISQPGDALKLTVRRYVHEQILGWNEERTTDRSAKASANRRYGELRKQNDVTTLLALSCCHMLYAVFSSLFYFSFLLYWKTVMIMMISKCAKGTGKSMSRIVSMRCYALVALISSVDTIRALSLY